MVFFGPIWLASPWASLFSKNLLCGCKNLAYLQVPTDLDIVDGLFLILKLAPCRQDMLVLWAIPY